MSAAEPQVTVDGAFAALDCGTAQASAAGTVFAAFSWAGTDQRATSQNLPARKAASQ